ncbi:MAG: hypothetical protein KJ057_06130 [Phycisphaerae bacterium]|nr:MAG: hypothetical protein F9K17_03220 [Phycisphaerae bacterium]MBE7458122.1 hypothetical protein [Planctomycetia bacterium]MCK6464412.1 hypothetical protein [Phycisphaerae bacterium]MCL4718036.1 hypothetical protein [Phycisphaerae bacterium]NUQ07702.1 hypothetical protein [Phycisphaerae bacterium]
MTRTGFSGVRKRRAGRRGSASLGARLCFGGAVALAVELSAAQEASFSPHWRADGCVVCHEGGAKAPGPVPREKVDVLCLTCHDGKSAVRERHPVGRTFSSDQVENRGSWPLVDGRLSCVTCHDFSAHCRVAPERPRDNPRFLRESISAGGSAANCGVCHAAARASRHNPHLMTDLRGGVNASSCGFCHPEPVASGASAVRTGRAALHTDEVTLCGACHTQHVDFFEPGHTGAPMTASLVDQLRRWTREAAAQAGGPDPGAASRAGAETVADSATSGLGLPLDAAGRVTCSTCHNPHERGVFPAENPLGQGGLAFPKSPVAPAQLRTDAATLCGACHGGGGQAKSLESPGNAAGSTVSGGGRPAWPPLSGDLSEGMR